MTCPSCFLPEDGDDTMETCCCSPGECDMCGWETTPENEYTCRNPECPYDGGDGT